MCPGRFLACFYLLAFTGSLAIAELFVGQKDLLELLLLRTFIIQSFRRLVDAYVKDDDRCRRAQRPS